VTFVAVVALVALLLPLLVGVGGEEYTCCHHLMIIAQCSDFGGRAGAERLLNWLCAVVLLAFQFGFDVGRRSHLRSRFGVAFLESDRCPVSSNNGECHWVSCFRRRSASVFVLGAIDVIPAIIFVATLPADNDNEVTVMCDCDDAIPLSCTTLSAAVVSGDCRQLA
jgi:hypothetical protein